ncbi:MAG: sugar transferase [Prevotella sp.]|uniref:sugar transferase n=1 Tax=Prevotella sp. TaxID=59823 RepID=UPI002A2947EF|nr:sugar transferase [Prevotella sp.]MDD7318619.1 sugar transferase [Prevotellaceae bacterium]MDY4019425.1 sugar transferase [Prevotella sp.]
MEQNDTDLQSSHDAMNTLQRAVKRLFDVVGAALALVLLSPLMLVFAILLKMQRNGPAIFCQERIGKGGKPFTIYKFRTMSKDNEKDGPQLVPHAEGVASTGLERFLRSHHLDELPQLWNVLRGDMSVVGPRPERKFFIDKIMEYDKRYPIIYEIRPGLTSEATLYNGYTDTIEKMIKRLEMDINYLETRSLTGDLKIMTNTVVSIVCGKKF